MRSLRMISSGMWRLLFMGLPEVTSGWQGSSHQGWFSFRVPCHGCSRYVRMEDLPALTSSNLRPSGESISSPVSISTGYACLLAGAQATVEPASGQSPATRSDSTAVTWLDCHHRGLRTTDAWPRWFCVQSAFKDDRPTL